MKFTAKVRNLGNISKGISIPKHLADKMKSGKVYQFSVDLNYLGAK